MPALTALKAGPPPAGEQQRGADVQGHSRVVEHRARVRGHRDRGFVVEGPQDGAHAVPPQISQRAQWVQISLDAHVTEQKLFAACA